MSMQSFEAATRVPFATRLVTTLLAPELIVLALLFALALATALKYPELMAAAAQLT
ncbi:MAG TPA: hypothetical protein VL244_01785 [Alphaproteobacteria bacterium]|nr:hypothetical protein [Alphaproteobacteria bacterium]